MFGDYIEAFHHDLADVVQFTGIAILVLGFSNFIWYAPKASSLIIANKMTLSGFQFKHVLADDRSSSCLRLFALEVVFGERRQTHTAVSWELACQTSELGNDGI
jgi:hypothetical protein